MRDMWLYKTNASPFNIEEFSMAGVQIVWEKEGIMVEESGNIGWGCFVENLEKKAKMFGCAPTGQCFSKCVASASSGYVVFPQIF